MIFLSVKEERKNAENFDKSFFQLGSNIKGEKGTKRFLASEPNINASYANL